MKSGHFGILLGNMGLAYFGAEGDKAGRTTSFEKLRFLLKT